MKKIFLMLFFPLMAFIANGQVSVVSINLQAFQVSPEALLNVNISNAGADCPAELQTVISNSANEMLVTVRSNTFTLKNGMNSGFIARTVKTTEYGSGNQANYIRTSKILPGGRFKVCVTVIAPQTAETLDDFCDEIESEFNQYLYLVNPPDKDTIETKNPLLIWNHSEPFSLLVQGEYYRMVVTEIKKNQNADEALTVNSPAMAKNYLNTHELQYPYDAKELVPGNRYAWQVQKMANGVVVNKSEAWEFTIKKDIEKSPVKYAVLKKRSDAGHYQAVNNKVYFRFDEAYSGSDLKAVIYDSKRNVIQPKAKNDKSTGNSNLLVLKNGYNSFEIDLNALDIKSGYHLLEITNGKGEKNQLNFYVE